MAKLRYFFAALSAFALMVFALPTEVVASDIMISSFVRDDCAHCQDQKAFFEEDLLVKYPGAKINYYDITESDAHALFIKVTDEYDLVKGTPITMVQDTLFQGFETGETTGQRFIEVIEEANGPITFEASIDGATAQVATGLTLSATCTDDGPCTVPQPSYVITLPLIGTQIDVGAFSLSGISLILGFVDGFNPCALWVLIMFLVVLSQLGSKKKMWQYAGIFILAEAIMYYGILSVWLTAWDFIGLNQIVTPAIGILALGSGSYFVYKFATYKPVCNVASPEQQKKISQRVKDLAAKPMSVAVFFGILGVAFSVNIFEFACSIGIPQTFTKILEMNGLDVWGRQWYMLLYILMYMVDDVIVFGIALTAMDKIGVTHKYSKWATLIGGLCMLALGLIMLLKPELLVF